ncbi:MAG: NAD(P)-dependent oxidoreductase [Leptolyngbya sp. SIO4C1]|nr:NAD(P)-dependent oxidoreductase [Leptolyngbya sp. SIO4C1]
MKLLITGASGFLGQYVVAAALRRGHQVRAVVRPATQAAKIAWSEHPNLEFVRLDLRRRADIPAALADTEAVIHLAAAKSGDFYAQFAGTVVATENLLAAMAEANVKRLVAISTFSVYDYINMESGTVLDETAPTVADPLTRDEYTQTKLLQETLVRNFEADQSGLVTILRPGVIYGRDNLWTARLGAGLGEKAWLRIGAHAQLPLAYVENCAEAIVLAAEQEAAIGQTLNVLDDNPPTQRRYTKQLMKRLPNRPRLVPVNWAVMRTLGDLAWAINQRFLGGQAKLPGILVPSRLQARFKQLQYSNQKLKQCLDWTPTYSLETALDRSVSEAELLTVAAPDQALTQTVGS